MKTGDIANGTQVKLISETTPSQGEFGTQNVAKARFKGRDEAVNVRLNKPTINGLIDAFGKESKDWMNHVLTAQTEKAIVAGKRVTILYLIPEGFELREDSGGYMVVLPVGGAKASDNRPSVVDDIEVSEEDVPF